MDSEATSVADDAGAPRRSGRVVKPPSKYEPEPSAYASKRKRGDGDDDDGQDDEDESDQGMSDDAEDDDDDEEHHPTGRSRTAAQSNRKKPSIKKPKTNGARPAGSGHMSRIPSRPKKNVRIEAGDKGTGLFAEIFGSGEPSQSVAQQWLEAYKTDDASAMSNLVNCILQCAGCDLDVTTDDIRDPENIPNRLIDLQNVYQEQNITDYPLISRAKGTRSFRDLLVTFFHTLIALTHETETMYTDAELMENLHAWLASMSSSALRPFRHTATTISLAVQSGLVDVAGILDRRIANIEQQAQAAKRGKTNKSKTAEIQRNLEEANEHRNVCSESIQSFFDTVFVHRYRDVDAKIRTECVEALGSWIWDLPTVFMEPGYLRYLGWMLSDTNSATRHEVLKQLYKVFKRDAQQLGHFIDRFRPRLIEIAAQDSEISVRVAAISVIDTLRAAALLDPSEIDAIGKLIFDNEVRIRRAVVNFFVACIQDVQEGKLEELGGSDILDEVDAGDEDDFDNPRKEWLDIKCLAEALAIYDAQVDEAQEASAVAGQEVSLDLLEALAPDSRVALAAQALYEKLPEIKMWEIMAGYLLFDHSTSTKSRGKARSKNLSPEEAFKRAVAPSAEEESILLQVLGAGVKMSLTQIGDPDKARRRNRADLVESQEDVAIELATTIPKLLNKFGAEPETAAIVLRLEHHLNLDVFQQLRQEASQYETLLDEISTQFMRHDDKRVLAEATVALLHARQYDELEELTDSKLSLLWENVVASLRNAEKTCEVSVRGNLAEQPLRQLSSLLLKISKLASISDCVDILEGNTKSKKGEASPIEVLINIVHRGKYEPQEDEIDDLEDELVTLAIKSCQFYFMWKILAMSKRISAGAAVSDSEIDALSVLRQTYRRYLIETFSSRAAIDQLRLFATGSLCDLHLSFATLRPKITALSASSTAARAEKFRVLVQDIEYGLVPEFIAIFDGAERQFAKKSKKEKALNEPAEDEDPVDDEDINDDDDDEDLSEEDRFAAELKAEKALCELTAKYVLAITGHLIDNRGSQVEKLRRRLLRNQTKLGNNFKEVLAYLDEDRMSRKDKKPPPKPTTTVQPASDAVVQNLSDIFDDIEPEEGSAADLRRRELLEDDPIDDEEEEDGENNDADDDILGD